jgi:alkanesulfonate monooxygenase SsuD/methylene tetrahydromethanopterin reductase-like flavin-dependent oxidoreductase (luciferase family)
VIRPAPLPIVFVAMDIGIALPTMAREFTRQTFVDWCHGIDAGPFSSVSAGERLTFHNPELMVTSSAAAALTERVDVMTNITVLPLHATALIAKQLATLDVLSGGRLVVGVGVGGREHDYRAAGVPFEQRHARLDEAVAEMRRLWAGDPPFDGADPIGPAPVQHGGPRIMAAALGPKSMRRAAKWADGVTGFSITAAGNEMAGTNRIALESWHSEGRTDRPRLVNGSFYVLGGTDPAEVLAQFTFEYLGVFGEAFARAMADAVDVCTPERLRQAVADAEEAGCDEFILVPGAVDISCLEETVEALAI